MLPTELLLDRQALSVLSCVHKEKTRYAMNGVFVDEYGFTATDGKILAHVTHERAVHVPGVRPTVISTGECKGILKDIGRGKKARPYTINTGDEKTQATITRLDTPSKIPAPVECVDGTFPPYRHVFPKRGAEFGKRTEAGFNASLLLNALKAVVAFGGKDTAVMLTFQNDVSNQAWRLDAHDGDTGREFRAILMPLRMP